MTQKTRNEDYKSLSYQVFPLDEQLKQSMGTTDAWTMSVHRQRALDNRHTDHSFSYDVCRKETSEKINLDDMFISVGNNSKTKTRYVPTRVPVIEKNPDWNSDVQSHNINKSKWIIGWKNPPLQRMDIQCIIGMRLLSRSFFSSNVKLATDTRKRIKGYDFYPTETFIDFDKYMPYGEKARTYPVLHVIYISRESGNINDDFYLRWCNETKLPFPSDLIHTELKNDKTWSDARIIPSVKRRDTYGYHLSFMDVERNKRKMLWFIPFKHWGNRDYLRGFESAYKSKYSKPDNINTWRKRRVRRVR